MFWKNDTIEQLQMGVNYRYWIGVYCFVRLLQWQISLEKMGVARDNIGAYVHERLSPFHKCFLVNYKKLTICENILSQIIPIIQYVIQQDWIIY